MHIHHQQTIDNLHQHFEQNSDYLALIVVGSVASGEAGKESDLDFYVVVDDQVYADRLAKNAEIIEANEFCVPPCPEANGYFTSNAELRELRQRGSEIMRWTFHQAQVVFSRDDEINTLVKEIPLYPEDGRIHRMESYHSQIYYHFSFFEFAYYSQTKYLIYETATRMLLAAGRLILADNRRLYPTRKWFFRELERTPDKPTGLCEAMVAFLDAPSIESGHKIIDLIEGYKQYPVPPEGMKARIAKESVLNLEEW